MNLELFNARLFVFCVSLSVFKGLKGINAGLDVVDVVMVVIMFGKVVAVVVKGSLSVVSVEYNGVLKVMANVDVSVGDVCIDCLFVIMSVDVCDDDVVVVCPNTQVRRVVLSVTGGRVLGSIFSVVITDSLVEGSNCVSGFEVVFGLHVGPKNVFKSHV